MPKCFFCRVHLGTYEGVIARIEKGEERTKGSRRTMDGCHICLDCAQNNPAVIKYKIIWLSSWKYPKEAQP